MVRVPRTHQFLGTPVERLVAPEGDRALALMPVVVDGVLIGIAGFAAAVGSTWEQGDMDLLQLVAQGVARTVERKRVDGALQRGRGPLPGDVRRLAAGHLPGGEERRRPVPEPGRPAHHRPQRRGDGRTRLDRTRFTPRTARASSRTGTRRSRRASGYTTPMHRFVHKNGDVRSVEVRAIPLAGQPHGVSLLGILEDVTDRLRAERERQDMLARTEAARVEAEASRQEAEAARADVAAILSRISDAFIALDLDGRFTYANDRALALCGHTRDEMIGADRLGG